MGLKQSKKPLKLVQGMNFHLVYNAYPIPHDSLINF